MESRWEIGRAGHGRGDKLRGHGVDYLTDNGVYCLRCFRVGGFHNRVDYPKPSRKATLNRILQVANGMLVNLGRKGNNKMKKCFHVALLALAGLDRTSDSRAD